MAHCSNGGTGVRIFRAGIAGFERARCGTSIAPRIAVLRGMETARLRSGTVSAATKDGKEPKMAGSRVPRTFGQLMQSLGNVVRGLETGAQKDSNQKTHLAGLAQALKSITELDRRQEALKVQLVQTTSELEAQQHSAQEMLKRVVSYLESVYGKTSPELNNYGIAPRRFVVPRKTKGETAPTAVN